MNGAQLIAAERQRHVEIEGYTPEHDATHEDGALSTAGACYALSAASRIFNPNVNSPRSLKYDEAALICWPWGKEFWKPTPNDLIRQLTKAGSLIAAEIDRIRASRRKNIQKEDLIINTSNESYWVDCCNEDCNWHGLSEDCVHPKHDPTDLLCPKCYEVVEPCDIL